MDKLGDGKRNYGRHSKIPVRGICALKGGLVRSPQFPSIYRRLFDASNGNYDLIIDELKSYFPDFRIPVKSTLMKNHRDLLAADATGQPILDSRPQVQCSRPKRRRISDPSVHPPHVQSLTTQQSTLTMMDPHCPGDDEIEDEDLIEMIDDPFSSQRGSEMTNACRNNGATQNSGRHVQEDMIRGLNDNIAQLEHRHRSEIMILEQSINNIHSKKLAELDQYYEEAKRKYYELIEFLHRPCSQG